MRIFRPASQNVTRPILRTLTQACGGGESAFQAHSAAPWRRSSAHILTVFPCVVHAFETSRSWIYSIRQTDRFRVAPNAHGLPRRSVIWGQLDIVSFLL